MLMIPGELAWKGVVKDEVGDWVWIMKGFVNHVRVWDFTLGQWQDFGDE